MEKLHKREHHSILASAERRLLIAAAARLPRSVTPDRLTLLALTSMVCAGIAFAYVAGRPWAAAAATVMLVLNWLGDSLDGTLARVRRCERPRYGYYIDHVVDLAGVTALIAGVGCSGAIRPALAAALLIAYLLVAAESFLATHVTGIFRLSFAGVGPTELRLLLVVVAWRVALNPTTSLLNIGSAIGAAGLATAFAISAARNARALRRQDSNALNGDRRAA
jgi:phosphatidylglycerophosphate synthase